ncbi:MAG: FAD-binding protein [Terriglobus roseus]|nr:FAD-binding protein [Terriglobus roseus]
MAHAASLLASLPNGSAEPSNVFENLKLSKSASLLVRGHASPEEWAKANYRWSENAQTSPRAIAFPATTEDVQQIVRFGTSRRVQLAVKGGGHAQWPCNGIDGGLVCDLALMRSVRIAEDRKSVYIGGGCRWGDVFPVTDQADLAVVGGGVADVGVCGRLSPAARHD